MAKSFAFSERKEGKKENESSDHETKGTRLEGEWNEWKSNEVRNCFSSLLSALSGARREDVVGFRRMKIHVCGMYEPTSGCWNFFFLWGEAKIETDQGDGENGTGRLSSLKSFHPSAEDFQALEYLTWRSKAEEERSVRLGCWHGGGEEDEESKSQRRWQSSNGA